MIAGSVVNIADGAMVSNVITDEEYVTISVRYPVEFDAPGYVNNPTEPLEDKAQVSAVRILHRTTHGYRHLATEFRVPKERLKEFKDHLNPLLVRLSSASSYQPEPILLSGEASRPWCYTSLLWTRVVCAWEPDRHLSKATISHSTLLEAKNTRLTFDIGNWRLRDRLLYRGECTMADTPNFNGLYDVTVAGVPLGMTSDEVHDAIPPEWDPADVRVHGPGAESIARDSIKVAGALLRLTDSKVAVQSYVMSKDQQMIQVPFIFSHPDLAQKAVLEHNGRVEKNLTRTGLVLEQVPTVTFCVKTQVLQAVAPVISSCMQSLRCHGVKLGTTPFGDVHSYMKLDGYDSRAVNMAMKQISDILDGRLVKAGNQPLWTDLLENGDASFGQLHEISEELGVVIVRDMHQKTIRVFGQEPAAATAEQRIMKMFPVDKAMTLGIVADAEMIDRVHSGGLQEVSMALQPDGARVLSKRSATNQLRNDMSITEQCILYKGPYDVYEKATRLLATWKEKLRLPVPVYKCSLCLGRPFGPVFAPCKHVFCAFCYQKICVAFLHGQYDSLRCRGKANGGKCGELLPLADLRVFCSALMYEQMLCRSAFLKFSQRTDVDKCLTMHCPKVYRRTPHLPRTHRCSLCFEYTCTACNHRHPNTNCGSHLRLLEHGTDRKSVV